MEPHFSKPRLVAIDYIKGLGVIWFILGHMMMYWLDSTWMSIEGGLILIMDWLAVPMFTTITVLGTLISIEQKIKMGTQKGMFKRAILKAGYLLILGEIMNLMIEFTVNEKLGFWHLFGANMISVIALAQILTYGLYRLSTAQKLALLGFLTIFYMLILHLVLIWLGYDGSGIIPISSQTLVSLPQILYYLLFNLDAMMATWSWIICATLASVVFSKYATITGQRMLQKSKLGLPTTAMDRRLRFSTINLAYRGIILIFFSIISGGFLLTNGLGFSHNLFVSWNNLDAFQPFMVQGIPLFLFRNTPHDIFFDVGILCIVVASLIFISSIRKNRLPAQDTIKMLGRYSLTIFFYHHVVRWIDISIGFCFYLIIAPSILLIIILVMKVWVEKGEAIMTFEWLLIKYNQRLNRLKLLREP